MSYEEESEIPEPMKSTAADAAQCTGGFASLPLGQLVLFAGAYAAAAALGKWLVLAPDHGATPWPPAGLYLAVLLQFHRRCWPRLILAALPAGLAVALIVYKLALPVSTFIVLSDTLAAVIGAFLVRSFCGFPFRCETLRDVLGLALFGGILGSAVGATAGASVLWLAGIDQFIRVWLLWWIANTMSVVVLAPLVTVILRRGVLWRGIGPIRLLEAAAMLLTLAAVAHVVFTNQLPLMYIGLPPLLWAALRFGMPGAVLALSVLTVIVVRYTASGYGVLGSSSLTEETQAFLVQSFVGIIGLSTLILAALMNQREAAQRGLQRAREELEDRVLHRTAELRDSEERLRLALDAAHAGTWESDLTTGAFSASERALELHGVPPGTPLTHRKALALFHREDRPRLVEAFRHSKETGSPFRIQLRLPQADGSIRWIASHAELRYAPAGPRLIGLVYDITERKNAEEALRLREREFREMFELAGVGKAQVDPPTWKFRRANARICQMLGYTEEELLEKTVLDITHPDDRESTVERATTFFGGHVDSYTNEKRYLRKDGTVLWVNVTAKMIRDARGKPLYIISDTQDITERKQAENALRESEERLRLALEAAQAGTWDRDIATGVVTRDPMTRSLLGLPEDAGTGADLFDRLDPIAREQILAVRRQAIAEHREFAGEFRVQRPDGSAVWVLTKGKPFYSNSGELSRLVGICMDITERKRIEEELKRYVAELKTVDRQKDDFIALLSHEMRNPLAPVLNAVQILRMRGNAKDRDVAWCTEVIDRQVRQMARLLDDLLDISRITRDKLELRKQPVELAPIINMAVETSKPLIEAGEHRLLVNLGSDPIIVDADAARIAQVIANLLNNAAKYSDPGGKITLDVEHKAPLNNGTGRADEGVVVIRVTDTGIGIPADKLAYVFEPFVQVDQTSERTQGGLGIGLALAKRLVEMHRGSIEVASQGSGHGSQFTITLPARSRQRELTARQGGFSVVANKRRVLVVDDLRVSADSLSLLLQMAGNEVAKAYSGPEALEKADALRPDIILMDLGMPGMDGFETARRIRERLKHHKLVMIAVSGWGQKEVRSRSIEAGFDACVTKPVDFPDLEKLMARLAA
jgi:PAS domain S-box-containing protein